MFSLLDRLWTHPLLYFLVVMKLIQFLCRVVVQATVSICHLHFRDGYLRMTLVSNVPRFKLQGSELPAISKRSSTFPISTQGIA